MKRTTVFLDDGLLARARRHARREGVSFATVVREALAAYLATPRGDASLPSIAGRFSSGSDDTAERADELLWRDPHA
jgi:hypothetical protein